MVIVNIFQIPAFSMNKERDNNDPGAYAREAGNGLTSMDLGVMICASCQNSVPFQRVRWSKKRQAYICFDCMKS